MRHISIIFKRELKAYFNNPLAYVLIIIYSLLSMGLTFVIGKFLELNDASLTSFFWFHPWIYMIFGPAIGMRLWSEEHRQGTTELLLTMPISAWEAIVGKFLAACVVLAAALLSTLTIVYTVYHLGKPDGAMIFIGTPLILVNDLAPTGLDFFVVYLQGVVAAPGDAQHE